MRKSQAQYEELRLRDFRSMVRVIVLNFHAIHTSRHTSSMNEDKNITLFPLHHKREMHGDVVEGVRQKGVHNCQNCDLCTDIST